MHASIEELSLCPGLGERKVKRLYNTFHQSWQMEGSKSTAKSKKKKTELQEEINKDEISITFDLKKKEKNNGKEEED
jgi:DNA excision repair protein ERCC-1